MQDLDIPDNLKALYKTVWEIKQRVLVDMAADRGAYIDQSQSFNVHMSDPNFGKLTSLHFYGWKVCSPAAACRCCVTQCNPDAGSCVPACAMLCLCVGYHLTCFCLPMLCSVAGTYMTPTVLYTVPARNSSHQSLSTYLLHCFNK